MCVRVKAMNSDFFSIVTSYLSHPDIISGSPSGSGSGSNQIFDMLIWGKFRKSHISIRIKSRQEISRNHQETTNLVPEGNFIDPEKNCDLLDEVGPWNAGVTLVCNG